MWNWGGQETTQSQPPTDTGQTDAVGELNDQLTQQQQLITHLKEMVRTNEQSLQDKEKELEENASKLSKIRLQHKAKVSQLTNQLQEAQKKLSIPGASLLPGGTTAKPDEEDDASSEGSHASHTEQSNRGRLILLKKKLEESKSALEKRDSEEQKRNREIEQLVGNLRKQLHEREEAIVKLQTHAAPQSSDVTSSTEQQQDNQGVQEMYAQMVYKDTKIIELNNRITDLEAKVMDFQDIVRVKEEIISSRNKALQLMADDLSRKGKATVDKLDETEDEMRQMQERFVTMESCWKEERERLVGDLETSKEKHVLDAAQKENRICDLKETVTKMEAARFEMNARNAALQQKVVVLQEKLEKVSGSSQPAGNDVEKLLTEVKDLKSNLEEKEKHIRELQSAMESDKSTGGKSVVKIKAQYVSRIKALEKQLAESKSSSLSTDLHQLQQQIAELEDEKGHLQLKLVDFDDMKAAEEKHQELVNELKTKLNQQSDDLTNHVRMVSLLQQEKMDFAESLAKARQEMSSISEQQSTLSDEKVALEMKVVELEECKDGLEERNKDLLQEIQNLKTNLENEKRPVMAIEEEKDALQVKLNEFTSLLQDKESKILLLEEELVTTTEKCDALEHKVHHLEGKLSSVEEQINTKEAVFTQVSEKQKKVQDLLSEFCEDHGILEPTVDQMSSKWDDMLSAQQRLQDELSQFCQRRNVRSLEELDGVWDTLKHNEVCLEEEVKKHKAELSVAQEQIDQLQKSFDHFKLNSKADKEELNASIKELSQANNMLNFSVAEKDGQLQTAIEDLEKATTTVGVLEGQVYELKSQVKAANEENVHLSTQIQEANKESEYFRVIVEAKGSELVQTETLLEEAKIEVHAKSKALAELEEKLQLHTNQNDKLHLQMETANQSFVEQLSDMELEVTRLQNIVDEKESIVRTLQEERDRLNKTTEGLAQELSRHKEEIHTLTQQKDKDIGRLQEQNLELQELKRIINEKEQHWYTDLTTKLETIDSLTLDLKNFEQTYEEIVEKLGRSEVEVKEKNKDLDGMQNEVLELKSRLQEVKESLSDKEHQRAKLEQELCEQLRTIEHLKEQMLHDAQKIEELRESKNELERNVETSSYLITDLKKSVEEIEASNSFLKEQLEMKGKDSEEQVISLQQERERLENMVRNKSTELQQLNSELQELRSTIKHLKEETTEQANSGKALQLSLDEQVSENQQLASKINDLSHQLSESTHRSEQLQSVINEVESSSLNIRAEKQIVEQKVVELQEVIAHYKHEKSVQEEKLTQSVSTLGSSNSELKSELNEYKDKYLKLQEELELVTQQFSAAVMKSGETDAAFSVIQSEVALANETISLQVAELQDYSKRLTEAEKRSTELEDDLRKSVNQVASFTERLQAAEDESAKLKTNHNKLEHSYQCNLQELDNEKESSALIRNELSEIAEVKRCLAVRAEEAELKLSQLTISLEESTELNSQLQSQLSSLQNELEDLKLNSSQQINALNSSLHDLECSYSSLTESEATDKKEQITKLKQLEDEKSELLGKIASLEQQLVEQGQVVLHLESEAANHTQLRDNFTALQEHSSVLQNSSEELKLNLDALQAENVKNQHAFTEANERNNKLSVYIEQLESDLQNIQASWENANEENMRLQEELVASKRLIASHVEQNQLLHTRFASYQDEQKELFVQQSDQLKETEEELKALKKHNEMKQIKIDTLINDADIHTANIALLQDSCREYQRSVEQLNNDLAIMQSKQHEVTHSTEQIQTLTQMVSALEEQVAVKQSELETNIQFVDDLQRAVACKDSVIEGLQNENSVQADVLAQSNKEIAMKQDEIRRLENDVQIYTQNIVRMQTTLDNFMESEGNKEEDRQKFVDQLNHLETSLTQERTDRHNLEMSVAEFKEGLENVSTQLQAKTMALEKVQSDKDSLEKVVNEMQEQMDMIHLERVQERESLINDNEQMKLYIGEQNKVIDVERNEKNTLQERIRKLGGDLNIPHYDDLGELLLSVRQYFESLEVKIPYLEAAKVESYHLLTDMIVFILGEDANELTIDAAKQAWINKNTQVDTLSSALEETNTTVSQLQQEVAMHQHDNKNLMDANKRLAERQSSNSHRIVDNNTTMVDTAALDFVDSFLEGEPALTQDASHQEYPSIAMCNIGAVQENNVDVLQNENILLKDEVNALKVQLSVLIDNQERSLPQSAYICGTSPQGQTTDGLATPLPAQSVSTHNYEQQLREIFELIESEGNQPVSFLNAKQILQAQTLKLEELTSKVLESEIQITGLQTNISSLQEENRKLRHANVGFQHQPNFPDSSKPKVDECAVEECLKGLADGWEVDDDEPFVSVEATAGSQPGNSLQLVSASETELDFVVRENFKLKEEIARLKANLGEMVNSVEINVAKHAEMLGSPEAEQTNFGSELSENLSLEEEILRSEEQLTQSMACSNSEAVLQSVPILQSTPNKPNTENMPTRNINVDEILKLIFAKVPDDFSLAQVKSLLTQKNDELENLSVSLLEMNVKTENLQLIIQNLQEENKALLDRRYEKPEHCKSATFIDDSVTDTLKLIESYSGSGQPSSSSSNIKSTESACEMDRDTVEYELLLRENLSLKDEVAMLKTKLSELIERSEVVVAEQGDMLGIASQGNELFPVVDTKSILSLIFNEEVVNSNPDAIKRALQQKNDRLDELTTMLLEAEVANSNLQLEIETLKMENTNTNKQNDSNKSYELAQSMPKESIDEGLKELEAQWADSRPKFESTAVSEGLGFGTDVVEIGLGGYSSNKEAFETLVKENDNLRTQVTDLRKRLFLIIEKTETATAQRASLLGSGESEETTSVSLAAEPTLSSVESDILSISPANENLSTLDTSTDSRFVELTDEIERLKELNDILESKNYTAEEKLEQSSKLEKQLNADLKTALQEKDGCVWEIDELKAENDDLLARVQELKNEVKRQQQQIKDERNQWDIEKLELSKSAKLAQPASVTEPHILNENLQSQDSNDSTALSADYTKVTEELGILKVKNGKMLAKLKQFKDKNDRLQKLLDAATVPKTEPPSVLDELRASIDELSQQKVDLESKLADINSENNLLKDDLKFFKDRTNTVESSSKSEELLKTGIQAENDNLKHQIEELSETQHTLLLENEKLKRVAADANDRSETLLSDNSTFQMLVESSKTGKAKLEAELKNQMTLLFHANEENKTLRKNIERMELTVTNYNTLNEKYKELESDWQVAKATLLETERSVDETRHKFQQLQRENETLRKDKVELELKLKSESTDEERITAYIEENKQLTETLKNAQRDNEHLLIESRSLQEKISGYREEIEELRTNATSLEQLLEGYKERVEVEQKSPPAVSIIDESRQFTPIKAEPHFSDQAYMQEQLDHMGRDRAKLQQSVSDLTSSVQEMKAQLELNISEKNSLLYKLEGWRNQSEKLNAENEEFRKRHQRLEDVSEQLETEKQSLMQQLHQMKDELEQAQWLCQRQNEEISTLNAVTEKHLYDLKNLSLQNESLLSNVQQLTSDKQSLEASSSSLQEEVTRLKSSNDSLTQQSDNWRKHLNSISSNLTLPDANAPSESGTKTIEPSLAHLQAELQQSMQSLHRRDQRCEELSEELTSLLEERDDLQLRLSALVRNQHNKDIQIQQLQRRLEDQEQLAHSAASQALSYHSSLEKVELGLEDDQQPLMLPATSYTLTRTMASTSWRIRSWMQGRKNYLHRTWKSRSSLTLLYYIYILCLHILVLFCAFER